MSHQHKIATINKDFIGRLLPFVDRRKFKNPCVPSKLWKRMGSSFDFKSWKRLLKKYNCKLKLINDYDFFAVSAQYYEDKIEMYICRPEDTEFEILKFQVIQTLMHELIHVNQAGAHEEQYDRLLSKNDPDEYLGKFGEIQAYAHDIVLEYIDTLDFSTCESLCRYDRAETQVKRELWRQIFRWLKYYN